MCELIRSVKSDTRKYRLRKKQALLNLFSLKSRILYIASSAFLIGTLLFAQIGVNFFHNNHDVHQNKSITAPLKAGDAGVQKHDEHCKVCSIDFFNHAFVASTPFFTTDLFTAHQENAVVYQVESTLVSFSQGRAPPVLS